MANAEWKVRPVRETMTMNPADDPQCLDISAPDAELAVRGYLEARILHRKNLKPGDMPKTTQYEVAKKFSVAGADFWTRQTLTITLA